MTIASFYSWLQELFNPTNPLHEWALFYANAEGQVGVPRPLMGDAQIPLPPGNYVILGTGEVKELSIFEDPFQKRLTLLDSELQPVLVTMTQEAHRPRTLTPNISGTPGVRRIEHISA